MTKFEHSKKRLIILGKEQMLKNQRNNRSYLHLMQSSISFISWKMWVLQGSILSLCLLLIYRTGGLRIEEILGGLTGLILLSALFFMDELFKSFTNKMWELEQTLKYDLRQHLAVKLLIFGTFDFFVIFVVSLVGSLFFPVYFLQLALYLLAPFNLFCLSLLIFFTLIRNQLSHQLFWIGSGAVLAVIIVISQVFKIYEFPIHYWVILTAGTFVGLCILIQRLLKQPEVGGII
ncbi:hypothetical protein [Enterococcus saccharolyticus]|uniref:hypothetical protein n=1 Tax=Enterococcus saccharolyticus TaxID=41997 RepID=UPI001E5F6F34|nr:hypothetical protein [Enterococcus saccharolyticus]